MPPTAAEGLTYVHSFLWKPPILIAWKPRADLDRAAMDPARETVVSSIYKVTTPPVMWRTLFTSLQTLVLSSPPSRVW